MTVEESSGFIERLKAGDSRAEEELVDLYLQRLRALARSRQARKLRGRYDSEDVVQSALGSFFIRVRDGRLSPQRNRLWSLLARITLNKAAKAANIHTAQLRDVEREEKYQSADGLMNALYAQMAEGPTDSEYLVLEEERQRLLEHFDGLDRQIVELSMEGLGPGEIAEQVARAEHQVRYVLKKARQLLEKWARDSAAG